MGVETLTSRGAETNPPACSRASWHLMTGQQSSFSVRSFAVYSHLFLSPANSYHWASEGAHRVKAHAVHDQ